MGLILNTCFILFLFNFFKEGDVAVNFHLQKAFHEPRTVNNKGVVQLAKLSDMGRFNDLLSNIMTPRVVGTDSHRRVKEFIIKKLRDINWSVETQESNQRTPLGQLTFTNIIARLNPLADRYLVLACHYDSKYMREAEFIGATDSAVPCAMMIDLAYALKNELEAFRSTELSLMLLFFDGEEAFVQWGPNDSIYGARSLAAMWDKTNYPRRNSQTNHLDRMDLLVLLDLLGTPDPTFYSYFKNTQKWYLQLVSAEKRLTELNQLKKLNHQGFYFSRMHLNANIEDDHLPFLRRDVPCVHVIPSPFPDVWHQPEDNRNALDMNTIDNLNKILRVFTVEYLHGSTRATRSTYQQYEDL